MDTQALYLVALPVSLSNLFYEDLMRLFELQPVLPVEPL